MLFKYTFKYILIGDYNTGKTAITDRFINNNYDNVYGSTIGVEYGTKIINVNDTSVKICIWDTSGQERFKAITESYMRDVTCAIIVFDLTNKQTFYNTQCWLDKVRKYNKNVTIILVGAKLDKFYQVKVNQTDIDNFIVKNDLHYFETSSKNNVNINELFNFSASIIIDKINNNRIKQSEFTNFGIKDTSISNENIQVNNNTIVKKKSCCNIL